MSCDNTHCRCHQGRVSEGGGPPCCERCEPSAYVLCAMCGHEEYQHREDCGRPPWDGSCAAFLPVATEVT
jgi:hypothetical protein